MVKLFISQPMRGLSGDEIIEKRNEIIENVGVILGDDVEVLDSYFDDFKPVGKIPVSYLAKSISVLAEADIAYFAKGWEDARGCKIEHQVAVEYGITTIEE